MKVRNFVKGFIVGLPITITIFDCVGYVAKVDGVSMQPCLNPESEGNVKDYVLLNRWIVRNFDIQRGNVVSLTSPRDPDQKIIKRVIGLEGDTVKTLSYKQRYVKIPQGHCWIEGDHRSHSMDSNFFGPVAVGLITAKATHIVWPPSRWQRLESRLSPDRTPNIAKNVHLETDHLESNLQLNACENCNNNQECSSFTTYKL